MNMEMSGEGRNMEHNTEIYVLLTCFLRSNWAFIYYKQRINFALWSYKEVKLCSVFTSFYQRCKNVRTCEQCLCKMFPCSGKILAKIFAVLSPKWVMLRFRTFWWHFLAHFETLYYFFCIFWTIWNFIEVFSKLTRSKFDL